MSVTTITLEETYNDAAGNPLTGVVTVTLTEAMEDTSTGETYEPEAKPVPLVDGNFSLAVVANDDTTTVPSNPTAQYTIEEEITGAPLRVYQITVPHATEGGVLKLSTVAPS